MDNHELEQPPIDYTLLGYRVETLIESTVPSFIVNWFHNNECGCIARREWLNDKHYAWRLRRLERLENNYKKAKEKIDRLTELLSI